MAFKAQDSVTDLDYDLNPYVNATGVTPEFGRDQIRDYFSELQAMYRATRTKLDEWDAKREKVAKDPAALGELETEYRAWQDENVEQTRDRRVELLAALCSDSPNVETLRELAVKAPRVFDAFEANVQDQLGPKGVMSAGS